MSEIIKHKDNCAFCLKLALVFEKTFRFQLDQRFVSAEDRKYVFVEITAIPPIKMSLNPTAMMNLTELDGDRPLEAYRCKCAFHATLKLQREDITKSLKPIHC